MWVKVGQWLYFRGYKKSDHEKFGTPFLIRNVNF